MYHDHEMYQHTGGQYMKKLLVDVYQRQICDTKKETFWVVLEKRYCDTQFYFSIFSAIVAMWRIFHDIMEHTPFRQYHMDENQYVSEKTYPFGHNEKLIRFIHDLCYPKFLSQISYTQHQNEKMYDVEYSLWIQFYSVLAF